MFESWWSFLLLYLICSSVNLKTLVTILGQKPTSLGRRRPLVTGNMCLPRLPPCTMVRSDVIDPVKQSIYQTLLLPELWDEYSCMFYCRSNSRSVKSPSVYVSWDKSFCKIKAPSHYDTTPSRPLEGDLTEADRKKEQADRQRRAALRSSVIQELRQQYSDAPEEIRERRDFQTERQGRDEQHRWGGGQGWGAAQVRREIGRASCRERV